MIPLSPGPSLLWRIRQLPVNWEPKARLARCSDGFRQGRCILGPEVLPPFFRTVRKAWTAEADRLFWHVGPELFAPRYGEGEGTNG